MQEAPDYLSTQIITYIGNKRSLTESIGEQIEAIRVRLDKKKLRCADLFSGSGIVSRLLKRFSSVLFVNDLELYSEVLSSCYLFNLSDFEQEKYDEYKRKIERKFQYRKKPGIICENYAPKQTDKIKMGERAFYTRENAERLDTYRSAIDEVIKEASFRNFFIAPLLTEASVHVNTSGIFKGFYKDRASGIGCFGGTGKNALSRILSPITLPSPVFSNFKADCRIFREDAISLAPRLRSLDIAYLDPPYNQHPYGSNYFMLNVIAENRLPETKLSPVSGIPAGWNRSNFNRRKYSLSSLEAVVSSLDSKFIIVSYSSEGFITLSDMKAMLKKYGKIKTIELPYITFRGSRNLCSRATHLNEYLFVLEKK